MSTSVQVVSQLQESKAFALRVSTIEKRNGGRKQADSYGVFLTTEGGSHVWEGLSLPHVEGLGGRCRAIVESVWHRCVAASEDGSKCRSRIPA